MKTIYWCFPGGRHKALTLSYDDGKIADRRLVKTMNQHGIRGTFHLNAGKFGKDGRIEADEVANLYAGHEISAHSLTHPTLTRLPQELVVQQLLEDRRGLETLAAYPVRGMSYPNGAVNPVLASTLPHLGLAYARTTMSTGKFDLPDDWYRWPATCHHNENLMAHAHQFNALSKIHMPYLFYVWGHSYEFDNDSNWEIIEDFCTLMGARAEVWYATNIEIVDYLAAARRLQYTVDGNLVRNPSAISVWISVEGQTLEIMPGALQILA